MRRSISAIRYALRVLGKSPGFVIIAALTLALGIGASTAIFTVGDTLLLRPLAYYQPERLVTLSPINPDKPTSGRMTLARFELTRDSTRSLGAIAAFTNETFNLTGRGEPEQLSAARVSWNFFDVLGVSPYRGRGFTREEGQPGSPLRAIVSHALWTRLAGESITLDSKPYTVIGVLPPDFRFSLLGPAIDIYAADITTINLTTPEHIRSGVGYLGALARLAPGVSRGQAESEMAAIDNEYRRQYPKFPDAGVETHVQLTGLQEQMVGNLRPLLFILAAAVGCILLIACANVASLLLSRALARKKEFAIRTALGASRGSLTGQLLTESLILATIGGSLGVLLSWAATRGLAILAAGFIPRADEIHIDTRVLMFASAVSVLSGMLFGIVPALQTSKTDVNSMLREESRGMTAGRSRNRLRNGLVVGQVALSMMLLIGAGLLIRSFERLVNVSPGFDAGHLLTMNISLAPAKYAGKPQMIAFYDNLTRAVAAIPGVQSAGVSSALPVNPVRMSPMLMEGQPVVPLPQRPVITVEMISPDYLAALKVPLLRGRFFNDRDSAAARVVLMVNQSLARQYWPNENPVGKHITTGRSDTPSEIVGVVGDVKNVNIAAAPAPQIYIPYAQLPWPGMNLVVRTAGDPHSLAVEVRKQIGALDKDLPVTAVLTMDEVLAASRAQPRLALGLIAIFSSVALLLAIVGMYGVIAYLVAQRTAEVGIRMALGADCSAILWMVIRHGLVLTGSGVAIGVAASLGLTQYLKSMLYQIKATDPATFVVCAAAFTLVALLACYLPARRATRVDPIQALRDA